MKVELEPGVWLDKGDGDPSRTLVRTNAFDYPTTKAAEKALAKARKYRPFKNAVIHESWKEIASTTTQ